MKILIVLDSLASGDLKNKKALLAEGFIQKRLRG